MQELLVVVTYKAFCIGCGTFVVWLGYRLYALGIFRSSGDIDATIKSVRLLLRRAAPGTLFVILGCAVIWTAVSKGVVATTQIPSPSAPPLPAVQTTSVAGAGDLNSGTALVLAQAINTVVATNPNSPAATKEVQITARAILREHRTKIAERYGNISPEDVEFFNKHLDSADVTTLSPDDKARWNDIGKWLKDTLPE
jgi:hypothetical protein